MTETHRYNAPENIIARLQPFLKPLGITQIANVTGLDRIGIPVVIVVRPNARLIAVSQGKGLDLEAAELQHVEYSNSRFGSLVAAS